jgi:hypothetical protein
MLQHPYAFSYAGLPLDGVDEFGCTWKTADPDGWFSGAPVRSGGGESRSGQDGQFPSHPLRDARVVTLSGTVRVDGTVPAGQALGLLEGAMRRIGAAPETGELVGAAEHLTLSGDGQLEQEARCRPESPHLATWQMAVKLPDPLLYDEQVVLSTGLEDTAGSGLTWPLAWPLDWGVPAGQTPGSVVVPNTGTAAYWPRLRVEGPVTNPVITVNETGDSIRYAGTLAAGQWLDIDCGNRRVLLNGLVSQASRVTFTGRWLVIPVGGASLSWAADTADPAASLIAFAHQGAFK